MDAEVTSIIGAEKYERNNNRNNYHNGYRLREWDTRVGTLQLSIPKLRHGSYFPVFRTEENVRESIIECSSGSLCSWSKYQEGG